MTGKQGRKIGRQDLLRVSGLEKSYAAEGSQVQAVRGVSFVIERGQFFTLLGPSGCGKTTTLQCIAGLETPDAGEIEMEGELVFSGARGINVPAERRVIGMVFQSYAIWPHMTVFDNVAFPLVHGHGRGMPKVLVRERVMSALAMVKLDALANRPAPYLSGGQQQRVALARAVVHQPRLLLFDEPLSNLDAKLREEMRIEIRQLTKTIGIAAIYVTHDQVEALAMSDRVAIMQDGVIIQEGTPREVYLAPSNAFSADFIGSSNLVDGEVVEHGANGHGRVTTEIGDLLCRLPPGTTRGDKVQIVMRPETFEICTDAGVPSPDRNVLEGLVEHASFLGESVETRVRVGTQSLRVRLDPRLELKPSDRLRLAIDPGRCLAVHPIAGPHD